MFEGDCGVAEGKMKTHPTGQVFGFREGGYFSRSRISMRRMVILTMFNIIQRLKNPSIPPGIVSKVMRPRLKYWSTIIQINARENRRSAELVSVVDVFMGSLRLIVKLPSANWDFRIYHRYGNTSRYSETREYRKGSLGA